MKTCAQCYEQKPFEAFARNRSNKTDGRRGTCKDCYKVYSQSYCATHLEQQRASARQWNRSNADRHRLNKRRWETENRARYLASKRASSQRNKATASARVAVRYATDPQFRLCKNMRTRVQAALAGRKKPGSLTVALGCSWQAFVQQIESQFQPGMNWDNYGKWHIDHIIPLCRFDLADPYEFSQAWNHTNMRPLWAADNLAKGASIGDAKLSQDARA